MCENDACFKSSHGESCGGQVCGGLPGFPSFCKCWCTHTFPDNDEEAYLWVQALRPGTQESKQGCAQRHRSQMVHTLHFPDSCKTVDGNRLVFVAWRRPPAPSLDLHLSSEHMHKVVHSRVNMSKLDLTPSSKRRVNSAMSAVYLSRAVALRQVNQLEKQVQELKEENQILRDQMTIDKSADPTVSGPVLSYQRLHHDKTWREHTRELTGFKSVKELDDLWEFLDGEGEASALKCRESLVPDEDRKYRPHSRPHARKHSAQDCFLFKKVTPDRSQTPCKGDS